MKKELCFVVLLSFLFSFSGSSQQQYKLRQAKSIMGMKVEATVYVKGMRKRTEAAGMMGMSGTVEIQQCDLKRTIKINDKKRVYFIEPFPKDDDIQNENGKSKPVSTTTKPTTTEKGGTIYMYHSITDSGERKKMYDLVARHVRSSMKIKPSADACTMKDSMMMKTDGWYIDLPEFNCPVNYKPYQGGMPQPDKPSCMDIYITKTSGKGKLGFPLQETTTMTMWASGGKPTEFTTSLETIEFSTAKLDSTLFTIPAGYAEVKSEAELQDAFNMKDAMNQMKNINPNVANDAGLATSEEKKSGVVRVAVYQPRGEGVNSIELQSFLVKSISSGNIQGIAVSSEDEARKYNCDYSLNSDLIKIKQGGKVGGLLKAIKNADPNAATSFTIENELTLKKLSDGSVKLTKKIEGKYDGKIDEAAKRSLEEESQLVLSAIN